MILSDLGFMRESATDIKLLVPAFYESRY